MSLTGRILLSFGLIAVTGLALLLNPIVRRVERQYLEAIEEPMVDLAEILAATLSSEFDPEVWVSDDWKSGMQTVKAKTLQAKIYSLEKSRVSLDFYVTDAQARVVYDSGQKLPVGTDLSHCKDVYLTLVGQYGARSTRLDIADPTSSVMYVGAPIVYENAIVGVLSVYKPQRSVFHFIGETKRKLIYLGAITLLLVLALGWLLSKWVTLPLQRLTEYAAAVARGEHPQVPVLPGRHLRILGETTDAMRQALEDRTYVESYVQTMTHEMKAPIAGIRAASELLCEDLPGPKKAQFAENICSESIRLQNLVEQLLALASLENRKELAATDTISLNALVHRVVEQHCSNLLSKHLRIECCCQAQATLQGEAFLIETALNNLIQNAIDFSQQGGILKITFSVRHHKAYITIEDEGVGIPEYAVDRIFDRFYSLPRLHTGRKSSGLGLCFAREAIELHCGELSLRNRDPGPGAIATVTLPV